MTNQAPAENERPEEPYSSAERIADAQTRRLKQALHRYLAQGHDIQHARWLALRATQQDT